MAAFCCSCCSACIRLCASASSCSFCCFSWSAPGQEMQADVQTMLPRLAAAAGGGHSTPLTGLMRGPNAVEAPLCSQIVLKHITSMLPLIKLAQPAQDAAGALPACPLLSHRASMCTTRPSAACMHPCQALPPHHRAVHLQLPPRLQQAVPQVRCAQRQSPPRPAVVLRYSCHCLQSQR